jgi:nucleoid-associated protein YgaU
MIQMPSFYRTDLFGTGDPYLVEPGDTWCKLANQFLGDANLWMIITSANGVIDATIEPEPGKIILVPSYQTALQVIAE